MTTPTLLDSQRCNARYSREIGSDLAGLGFAAVLLCLPNLTKAQIVAPAGRTLFNQAVMVRSLVRIENFSEPLPGVSTRRIVNPNAVVWGAYPNLNLTFVAPLVHLRTEAPNLPARDFTTTSLGDGLIFARYDLLHKNAPRGYTRLSPEIGLKVPSGGAFGTGSTDPIGTIIFSHVRDPHWLVADAQFTYSTSGDIGLRMGNRWNYDLAYLHRLLPWVGLGTPALYLVLEMNGDHMRRARLNKMPLLNSGGNLVFVSPGVEFQPTNRLVVEFSAPIPVRRDLNGDQLRPTSTIIVGIRWLF